MMQAVHEFGHCCGAWLSGGTVQHVDLHPLRTSQTLVSPNPHPLAVNWSGPVLGCLLPLLTWGLSHRWLPSVSYLIRFFAGFCCVSNGAYIGLGIFYPVGDARDLLIHDVSIWMLGGFGLTTVVTGFAIWNELGKEFGLSENPKPISKTHAITTFALLLLVVTLEYI